MLATSDEQVKLHIIEMSLSRSGNFCKPPRSMPTSSGCRLNSSTASKRPLISPILWRGWHIHLRNRRFPNGVEQLSKKANRVPLNRGKRDQKLIMHY